VFFVDFDDSKSRGTCQKQFDVSTNEGLFEATHTLSVCPFSKGTGDIAEWSRHHPITAVHYASCCVDQSPSLSFSVIYSSFKAPRVRFILNISVSGCSLVVICR